MSMEERMSGQENPDWPNEEEFLPSRGQQIVKYLFASGQGNDAHVLQCPDGSSCLALMPKKFRDSTQPRQGDCLVIGPSTMHQTIPHEIICHLPLKAVLDLIRSGRWVGSPSDDEDHLKSNLMNFFSNPVSDIQEPSPTPCARTLSPSFSQISPATASDSEDEIRKKVLEVAGGMATLDLGVPDCQKVTTTKTEEGQDLSFKSCVQFLTSGVVTVASVAEMSSVEHGIQSLDFETEDSSEESTSPLPIHPNPKDFQRQANTIRIQVNYPRGMEPLEKRRNSSTLNSDFIQPA